MPHEIRQNGGDKGLLRRNQFGFNVAGPAVLPHLVDRPQHVFLALLRRRARGYRPHFLQTIPTMAQRTGDYSDVVDDAGNVIPIYDPATTAANPGYDPTAAGFHHQSRNISRLPFPGNIIPAIRLDPVALNALKFYPAPNTDVGPFFHNNYFIDSPETNTANGMIGKLDQSAARAPSRYRGTGFFQRHSGRGPVVPHRRQSRARPIAISRPRRGSLELRLHRFRPHREHAHVRSELQRLDQRRQPRTKPITPRRSG